MNKHTTEIFMKRLLLLSLLLTITPSVMADEWAPKEPVGMPFPRVNAVSQFGEHWDTGKLLGKNGLLFLFNRSTDW